MDYLLVLYNASFLHVAYSDLNEGVLFCRGMRPVMLEDGILVITKKKKTSLWPLFQLDGRARLVRLAQSAGSVEP